MEEFNGYIDEYKDNLTRNEKTNDDDDDDDDDHFGEDEDEFEMDQYTEKEIVTVRLFVKLIDQSFKSLKASLQAVTQVADSLYSKVDNLVEEDVRVKNENLCTSCAVWIESIVDISKRIDDKIVDVGAMLYPPFDLDDDLKRILVETIQQGKNLLYTSKQEPFIYYMNPENNEALEALCSSFESISTENLEISINA